MSTLVLWATDTGFIIPSLVAASQLRAHEGAIRPDIRFYLSDFTDEEAKSLTAIADLLEITLVRVSTDILKVDATFERHFQKGISPTALMRLAVADQIPTNYDTVVYLDGDMQIHGPLDDLLLAKPPLGKIAAVAECYAILKNRDGTRRPWLKTYLETLGLSDERQYLNSGMLVFKPQTWPVIAREALDFFRENAEICPNYDQCALNAVLKGSWSRIHPYYNWNSHFNGLAGTSSNRPRIVHFTGRPKPWQPGQHSWSPDYYKPYAELIRVYPEIERYMKLRDPVSINDYARHFYLAARRSAFKARYRRWMNTYLNEETFLVGAPK